MKNTLLDAIGNIPLVQLQKVVPSGSARIVAKLESANPTGGQIDALVQSVGTAHSIHGELVDA